MAEELMPMRLYRLVALVPLCVLSLRAGVFTIGPGTGGGPNNGFYSITTTGDPAPVFDLGDGSLGLNGGLAYRTLDNLFYAIANDSNGDSSLISFSPAGGGTFTTVGSLGQGFVSGLAYSSAEDRLYAISTDMGGNSSLSWLTLGGAVNPVGALGTGFYGGLTYRDGLLYAFSGDSFGVQRQFQSIDPATAVTALLFALGDGSESFDGGVAYLPGEGLFYVISNGWTGSTLQSFSLDGTLTPIASIGGGFWNRGMAAEVEPVPEPSTWLPLATLTVGLALWLRRRRR